MKYQPSVSHQSIRVYLAAICCYHIANGFSDPLMDKPLMQYLCQGIKRHQGSKTHKRAPITLQILQTLKHELRQFMSISPVDKRMFWSAFMRFSRASEFTCPTAYTFNSKLHLYTSDVSINDQRTVMSVLIKGSKTGNQLHCT